jgi:hypothetical protein
MRESLREGSHQNNPNPSTQSVFVIGTQRQGAYMVHGTRSVLDLVFDSAMPCKLCWQRDTVRCRRLTAFA